MLLVIGFYFAQHRTVPSIPLPANAAASGTKVKIPFVMQKPSPVNETWVLTKSTNQQFFVGVYVNERMIRRFQANRTISKDASGVEYTSIGDLKFNGQAYQVVSIHINPDNKSGFITFKQVSNTSKNP